MGHACDRAHGGACDGGKRKIRGRIIIDLLVPGGK